MSYASLQQKERTLAEVVMGWAISPSAASVDLDLSLAARRVMRRCPFSEADQEELWLLACRLARKAHTSARPIEEEPVVRLARQLLG